MLESVVVDACIFIKGHSNTIPKVAKVYYTTEECLGEVRDQNGRDALLRLPFELKVKYPSDQAMQAGNYLVYIMIISIYY